MARRPQFERAIRDLHGEDVEIIDLDSAQFTEYPIPIWRKPRLIYRLAPTVPSAHRFGALQLIGWCILVFGGISIGLAVGMFINAAVKTG